MTRVEEIMKLVREYGDIVFRIARDEGWQDEAQAKEEILEEIEQLLQMYIPQAAEETKPTEHPEVS